MNVLVIGSGGREHAIVKEFSKSKKIAQLYCAPGNAGIALMARTVELQIKNHRAVADFCKLQQINLVVIGPEDPLVDGLSDFLRSENVAVFGPSKFAAQLEGSKIFAKDFMLQANVPTAKSIVVKSVDEALQAAKNFTAPYILKADGLAAGKGVFICKDLEELKNNSRLIFEEKILGEAGSRALLEQNLPGKEISFLILTNGENFQALPLAQDHKRLKDDNMGPNTGGMGTVAPMHIDSELYEKIISRIVKPSVQNIKNQKMLFNGVLFIGLMIVENEPYVLEYNVRFGDPETQVLLPLIENDLVDVFFNLSKGHLETLAFKELSAVCIVNAANGYPETPVKGTPIEVPSSTDTSYVLHAGTRTHDNQLVSNGGRVLNILGIAKNYELARKTAYELNAQIKFEGRQFRTDIGKYR